MLSITSISPEEEKIWGVVERVFSYTLIELKRSPMGVVSVLSLISLPSDGVCHKALMKKRETREYLRFVTSQWDFVSNPYH